jgi:glycerol-3-phosphate dehydrogenase
VLSRRTRAGLLDEAASAAAARDVADLLAPELGWDAAETARQAAAYRSLVAHESAGRRTPEATVEDALDASLGA